MIKKLFGSKSKEEQSGPNRVPMKRLEYPGKVLLAWGAAIDGDKKIRDWLIENGFKELGLFVFALHNKDDAREWLMENGFPHLLAMINGAEGNEGAIEWLEKHDFPILKQMAIAGDGEKEALEWLLSNGYKDFAVLATKIRNVKDEIEFNNNDIHRISKE